MTRAEANDLVLEAVAQLVEEQRNLLALDVSERALCHQLAGYIARRAPAGFDVDVEYNRHHDDPKRLNLPRREALDDELRATTVFPDIIVHVRDSDESNEIVLELKKPGESLDYDELKLRAFHDELGYEHCAHLVLGADGAGKVVTQLRWLEV